MVDENEVVDVVETNDVNDEIEVEEQEIQEESIEPDGNGEGEETQGDEEVIIQVGDDVITTESDKDPTLVRELRKLAREKEKRIKELESLIKKDAPQKAKQLRKKPQLEDFDYDAEQFESDLLKWADEKRDYDNYEKAENEAKEKEIQTARQKVESYETAKKALKVPDYDDAESVVSECFDNHQQNVILFGSDDPALLVYALGKSPSRAKEFASEKDLAKLAFKLGKFEGQLKVTNRQKPPAPEKVVTGNASLSGSKDATLERLRAKAEKTGDMSEVMAYKRKLKSQTK